MSFLKYLTAMSNNKAREINSPIIKQLIDETTPEELAKIDTEMTNNKQQTALQEHIEWLKEQLQQCIDEGYSSSWIYAYELAIDNAESMLKKEQEQIEKAFRIGATHELVFGGNLAEKYYNKTYGDDKQ